MRTNFTIFLLFFGVAVLDSIKGGQLLRIVFWLGVALVFLLADYRRQFGRRDNKDHQATGTTAR